MFNSFNKLKRYKNFNQVKEFESFSRRAFAFIALAALSTLLFNHQTLAQRQYMPADSPGVNSRRASSNYQKGLQAFQIGDYVQAVNFMKLAQNDDPSNKKVCHMLALAYAEAGDTYNANLWFGSAITLDYNYVECRNNYALFMRKTGKTYDAEKMFEETIKINPKYPDAHYHLGEMLRDKGDLDNAIEQFHDAIRCNPNYFDALQDLGLAMYQKYSSGLCDISESLEKLQEAERLIPQNPMIHYYLGNVYSGNSQFDAAETEYRKALQCDPKFAAANYEFARVRYYRGDVDRCLLAMREAEKITPVYAESKKYPAIELDKLKMYKASCCEVKGLGIDAVDTYKEAAAMQLNVDRVNTLKKITALERSLRAGARRSKQPIFDMAEVQALVKKGVFEIEGGDYESAKKTYGRILEIYPECYEAVQHLGEISEISGDLNGALTKYQQAQLLRPQFGAAFFNLGVILEKMGLASDAGMMYQRFHEIDGKYPYDPRHIVSIQQDNVRQRERELQFKKRGY
ncbi:MAG: tetratricopeptide repeat protein [Candidatus Melainabacteria bacterium]|nr:tetratricopeptide repeat protein [Candidatus Melainabacteria bacterium]